MGVSPIEAVKSFWDGKLPAFDTMESLNVLIDALVMGLR
jgi:hypothetical protein